MFTQFCGIVPRQKITHTGKGETLLMGKSNITERNFAVTMEAAADITPFSNREVKSSAFTQLFREPENAAQLYTALDGKEASPEDINYTTLEDVLFVARKNDMAFTVRNRVLVISEHQSTLNQNMPLRSVIYYGRTMEWLVEKRALYRNRLIPIPTPEFYIFYNGTQPYPLEKTLRLSDSYIEKPDSLMLELVAKVININLPENHAILRKCRPLYEYSWFIQRIREYMRRGQERDTAVLQAVKDCEKEGILAEFVRKYGSEVVNMLFTQFNMDDALEVRYEEGREDGIEQGRKEGKEEGKEEGEFLKLIKLICLKLKKEKTVKAIAEELEEEESKISQICAVAKKCNLDVDRIYSEFQAVLEKDDGKAITGH